jgi:hypothetical protein
MNNFIQWLEQRFNTGFWFRRGIAIAVLVITIRLTEWGMRYADSALAAKADLLGVAAVIGAVAAVPIGLVTLLFSKYQEWRQNESNGVG